MSEPGASWARQYTRESWHILWGTVNGTQAEWIEVLQSLEELFNQYSLKAPKDKENAIKAILQGDSLTLFESSTQSRLEDPKHAFQLV